MDFIFDAFGAWNSFGMFLMAAVFILIGGGILGYELMWRFKGKSVKARIKEIRVVGKRKEDDDDIRTYHSTVPDKNEVTDASVKDLKNNPIGIIFLLLFLGMPLGFSGMGAYMGYKYYDLKARGEYAQARIVDNEYHTDSDGAGSYKAVLSFNDYSGRSRRVKDTISYGSSPSFSAGSTVGVYYDSDDPEKFVIDDYWHNMAIAVAFMCVFPIFFGFIFFISRLQKRQSGTYQKGNKKGAAKYANETYYAVYEYQLPNGERTEHVSDWGSNMLGKNIPGRQVNVLVSAHNPEKMKKPSMAAMIFGFIFFLPGVFIGVQAVKTFEFNVMTVLLPFAILGFFAFKISRFISKIPKKEFKEGMKALREDGFSVTMSSGRKADNARALSTSEIRERMKAVTTNYVVGGYVCFLIAIGLAGGSYYTGNDLVGKLAVGVPAQGEVVDFESRYSSSSEGSGYTYYSVVRFVDENGRSIKFRDKVGSSHRMHKRGEQVDVLYDPQDSSDAMIDRGIWNWLISGGLALGAFLLMLAGIDNMRTARLYGGRGIASRV